MTNRRKFHQRPIQTWDKLKRLLKQRFLPCDFEGVHFTQRHQCCQGNRSVIGYANVILKQRLSSRNNLYETEEQLIARFVQGPKRKFHEKLILQPQHFLMETIRVADQLDNRMGQFSDKGLLSTPEDRRVSTQSRQNIKVQKVGDKKLVGS